MKENNPLSSGIDPSDPVAAAPKICKPITLGNTTLPGNLFLAPLAGFTDAPFREIALQWGADFTFTEMVSAEALARNNKKTEDLMRRGCSETLLGIQIFFSSPETALRALPRVMEANPTLIDVNCGCPVPKITKTGCGSALMRDPPLLEKCIRVLVDEAPVPITVKIRSGWDSNNINYTEAAKAAEQGGAAMITLHPRTKTQMYSGTSCRDHLATLKKEISVPLIGSGDLFTPESVESMLRDTGIDGVMIARGAIGNPFIFTQTKQLLIEKKDPAVIDRKTKINTAIAHLEKAYTRFGPNRGLKEIRKHLCAYTKGIPGGSKVRNELVQAETLDQYLELLLSLVQNNDY